MEGVVTELGTSGTGKPKVKIDNQWYSAGRTDISGMRAGMRVIFEGNQFQFNGKQMWGLNSWKVVADKVTGQAVMVPTAVSDDATMRFISNVVGSAIIAKTIMQPSEIAEWVSAARGSLAEKPNLTREQVARLAQTSPPQSDPEFNDDLPPIDTYEKERGW